MQHHLISMKYFGAFLNVSGFEPNKLSPFVGYDGNSLLEDFSKTSTVGLCKNGNLTQKGITIAKVICQPLKSIIVSSSEFDGLPSCVFSYNLGIWVVTKFHQELKTVEIIAPIIDKDIDKTVKDYLIGNWKSEDFSPYSITLTSNEAFFHELLLLLENSRYRSKGAALTKEESKFSINQLFGNDGILVALMANKLVENKKCLEMLENPDLMQKAWNGLLEKNIIEKYDGEVWFVPGKTMKTKLAPYTSMINIRYTDAESGKSFKYYVFPDVMLQLTANEQEITFTQVSDMDYSVWDTSRVANYAKEELTKLPAVKKSEIESKVPVSPVEKEKTVVKPVQETHQSGGVVNATEQIILNFCPFCGRKVLAGAKFCVGCGKKLR